MTAILDKVAAGELLGRRQDMATNQLLSHALEQLLARSKRLRDTEAATMNMRLGGLRDGRAAGASLIAAPRTICGPGASRNDGGHAMHRTHRHRHRARAAWASASAVAGAQIVVTDPATTVKNAVIAALKSQLLETLTEQARQLRRMAQTPQRVHRSRQVRRARSAALAHAIAIEDAEFLYANPYTAALNYGDARRCRVRRTSPATRSAVGTRAGGARRGQRRPRRRRSPQPSRRWTWPTARSSPARIRPASFGCNGRRELHAIDALERDVDRSVADAKRHGRPRQDQRRRCSSRRASSRRACSS